MPFQIQLVFLHDDIAMPYNTLYFISSETLKQHEYPVAEHSK